MYSKIQFALLAIAALGLSACNTQPMVASSTPNTSMSAPKPVVAMTSTLSAANEVPANASAGAGTAQASFDPNTSTLSWTVTYSGLTGPVTAGHFHGPALPGANAGVALGFSGALASPIKGSAVLTAAQAADLMAGKWYINLHTAANAPGEIRGQMAIAK
jgi:CHRD domain